MSAEDLQSNPLKCYLFIETLRQAKKLGITTNEVPEQIEPAKGLKEGMEDDQPMSPQELPSASPQQAPFEQNKAVNVESFQAFEDTRERNFPINFDLEQKPIQPLESSNNKKDERTESMSPTFKPEKLEYMRDLPLQMPDENEKKKKLAAKK